MSYDEIVLFIGILYNNFRVSSVLPPTYGVCLNMQEGVGRKPSRSVKLIYNLEKCRSLNKQVTEKKRHVIRLVHRNAFTINRLVEAKDYSQQHVILKNT